MAKQSIALSGFKGIAPRYGDQVKPGVAVTALNCELNRGKLGPRNSDILIEAGAGGYNSIVKFGDTWVYGTDAYFLQWKIGDTDLLIYLDSGTLKRRIGSTVVDLGQPIPSVPTATEATSRLTLSDLETYEWRKSSSNSEVYCTLIGGGDPSLTKPDTLYINGAAATEGTMGSLTAGQWDYGDNDTLGFSTIYVKLSLPASVGSATEWVASSQTDHYYLSGPLDWGIGIGQLPYNPEGCLIGYDEALHGTFYLGTIGALAYNECAYGDLDTLGYTTLYIKFDQAPVTGGWVRVWDTLKSWHIIQCYTFSLGQVGAVEDGNTITWEKDAGDLTGTYRYLITVTREVDGYQDESGPSEPTSELTVTDAKIQVAKPAITESSAAYWNLYRISTDTGEYQLVAQIPIATATYTDNIEDADLGVTPPGWYTSTLGNEIIYAKPPTGMDGISVDIHAGMIFAWKGSTLYFSEPGAPDAWPDIYTIKFQSDIKHVIPFAGSVAVLCETGPYRIDGTNPEQLQQSKPLGREPCIGSAACATNKGVMYLSDTGLVLFNLVDTQVFSLEAFTEDWFEDNVTASSAMVCASHDTAFLFHSGGVLLYNSTTGQWTTLSLVAEAIWVNPEDGDVYFLVSGSGIYRLFDGDAFIDFQWASGQIKGRDPEADKRWLKIRGKGSGTVAVTASVDGMEVSTKSIDLGATLDRDRQMNLPASASGKALALELSGSGSVEELIVEYEL